MDFNSGLMPMRFRNILFILIMLLALDARAQDKLVFAIDLIRHGDRTPIYSIPALSHYHQGEGAGQLTPEGMQQEYRLGRERRKIYIEHDHLLPFHYERQTMMVRSSDYDRTLMSAQSFLMGLYPPGTGPILASSKEPALPCQYQPIPIHTIPQKEDSVLVPRADRAGFTRLLKKYVFSTKEWHDKNIQLRKNYPKWSKALGVEIKDLMQLSSIGNSLYIDQLHHVPLPAGLSATEINDIIENGRWVTAHMFKPYAISRQGGHDLLFLIANQFEAVVRGQTSLKYLLLSAHDSTILMAMSAMRVPLQDVPPYASDLNFSLYETAPSQYVMKITYNGKPITLPVCQGSACTLEEFKTLL